MSDDLEEYKPKDAPCHYSECLKCGGNDSSWSLSIFGLCLKCWWKYKKKIPREIQVPLGRMLLFSNKLTKQ